MNVISIQSNNMVDDIIINYSVTDKADGEHFALLVYDNYIYLISSNLEVKFTNIQIKDKNYNNTILDGELIYLKNKIGHIFLNPQKLGYLLASIFYSRFLFYITAKSH